MANVGTSDRRSDNELVEICNQGDAVEASRAFETLYRRHKDYVLRIARRFVHDNDMALDVLQETFGYLLRKFRPAGSGLVLTARMTTFLYPVAKNLAITMLRKADRFSPTDGRDPDELLATDGNEQEIAAVIAGLSTERREVVMLRFVDDMSLQEIADLLEIPLGTVKSRLHVAIRELKGSPDVKKFFEP